MGELGIDKGCDKGCDEGCDEGWDKEAVRLGLRDARTCCVLRIAYPEEEGIF
jgi:hypothetical protein